MHLTCDHCQSVSEFGERRPSFCPHCGSSLGNASFPPRTPLPRNPVADVRVADDEADPEAVGGYRLLRVLGKGGMGKVYEAEDAQTGRRVALKLVMGRHARAAEGLERFRREGRLAGLIAHPRCVFVIAAEEEAGRPYIVMELMPGENLDDGVKRDGRLPVPRAVGLILDVLEGLREAHRVGVVHRDVKPSNCFLDRDGRAKVGDFGLAKSLAQDAHLTKTGLFLGTPLFASPEQVRGETVDAQSDLYSTAATLYFLLTGRAPHQTGSAAATLARIVADPAPSMRTLRPDLPPELDAVVLRGLERDRRHRWQTPDEFAAALRPFLSGRISLVSLGLRFGAWMLDLVVLLTLVTPVLEGLKTMGGTPEGSFPTPSAGYSLVQQLASLVVWALYLGVPEALWGCSVSKALVRLRVRDAATGGQAGWRRGMLRLGVFYLVGNLGTLTAVWLIWPLLQVPPEPNDREATERFGAYFAYSAVPWAGLAVGVGALLCTMRTGNGYRGLHEWLSGTCVVPLPRRARRPELAVPATSLSPSRSAGVPERIGAYEVRGAYHWGEGSRVLLGLDRALERHVVLWLRPATEPPLPAGRRDLNRTTRLRWVAAGLLDDWQWDAFLAPGGCSLAEWIDARGKMPWGQFQPLLQQLTEEVGRARSEDNLPAPLTPDLVWVRDDGSVLLLDTVLNGHPVSAGGADAGGPDPDGLRFLGRVAVEALEGRHVGSAALPPAVREPLPLEAAGTLGQLLRFEKTGLDLDGFNRRLLALRNQPPQARRRSRLGQLLLLAAFQVLAFGWCIPAIAWFARYAGVLMEHVVLVGSGGLAMAVLDEAAVSDYLICELDPHPATRLGAAAQLEADLSLRRELNTARLRAAANREERLRRGGTSVETFYLVFRQHSAPDDGVGLPVAPDFQPLGRDDVHSYRTFCRRALNLLQSGTMLWTGDYMLACELVGVLLGPLVWVLWAFAARGGLSYRFAGLALVRGDGRPAGRFRALGRALLVWAPFVVLLLVSLRLDRYYWMLRDAGEVREWLAVASSCLWWGGWLMLAIYFALALMFPRRGLHDYLVGTYVVPR